MNQGFVELSLHGDGPMEWLEESLREGGEISKRVLPTIRSRLALTEVIVPAGVVRDSYHNLRTGGILDTKLADLGIAKALRQLCSDESAKYLLYVEDDLRRPGDPAISNGQAGLIFLRDQVVHWCELAKDNVSEVGTFLRKGSSGFPLNAFVAQFPMRYLRHEGLSESELLATITDSVVAVVVAAYDAESFLIWHPVGIQP